MKDGDVIRSGIDREKLLGYLESFYGTSNHEQIAVFMKRDLKDSAKFNRLMEYVGFDEEEFFFCCAQHFYEIFNKATLKHIKRIMNERRGNI